MLLCLDVGNTHILGGVFDNDKLIARFRYATHLIGTADQFGIFLINILQFNKINPRLITATAMSSVVPGYDFTIRHTISLYFHAHFFILQSGVKTGLNIKYKNPNEVGADRVANAIGAIHAFPDKNLMIIDMGTATTIDVVTQHKDYLGGMILPGMRLGMESLKANTAKLMEIDIEIPHDVIGRTTRESIQSGLFYGHLGSLKELLHHAKQQAFANKEVLVIGTGGFAQLFKDKNLFDVILPDLVLQGLYEAYTKSVDLKPL